MGFNSGFKGLRGFILQNMHLESRNMEDGGVPALYQALLPKKDHVERFHLFFFYYKG